MDYPIRHVTKLRVAYYDTDRMGVVWHGNYLKYFEIAREALLRAHGLPYSEIEKAGVMMPISDAQVRYLRPAVYDEILFVEAVVEEPPRATIHVAYTIRNEAGETNATGSTTLAFVDAATRRPCRPPNALRRRGGQAADVDGP
ncbi:MAG: acyl-CoA thioesterase [Kiritimatiellia bacterium]|jgi:acyl-CoA thioester hydrolase